MIKSSKRTRQTKDGRTILKGKSFTSLRMQLFVRAGGICECGCGRSAPWPKDGGAGMPWEGQAAHWPPKKMGNGFGSDTMETMKWMLGYCHDKLDNRNQKVVPRKA